MSTVSRTIAAASLPLFGSSSLQKSTTEVKTSKPTLQGGPAK